MEPCAVAKLLTAIFGDPLEETFDRVGLALCPKCDRAGTNPKYYPYCSEAHTREDSTGVEVIPLVCDECQILFYRRASAVRSAIKSGNGLAHVWCSNQCQGKWTGREHGWAHHPRLNKPKKYCKRGHLRSGENLYPNGNCKACKRYRYKLRHANAPLS
jgi:hypothetical protein